MKAGCGCLVVFLIVASLAGSTGWVVSRILLGPVFRPADTTEAEASAGQEKLFKLLASRPDHRGAMRNEPLALSEHELNGFVSRHLVRVGELPLTDLGLRLAGQRHVEIVGRVPLRTVLSEPPLSFIGPALPAFWSGRRIWLYLDLEPRLEPGTPAQHRYLTFVVHRFALGQQALPAVFARLVLDPGMTAMLRWRLPKSVDAIDVERGRVLIRTAS